VLAYIAIHYSPVQTWLVKKVSGVLSEKLHTEVKVDHVDISLLNNITAEGVLVRDLKKDTLLSVRELSGKFNNWFVFKDSININEIKLTDVIINLNRKDSTWNYSFLLDYFSSPRDPNKKKKNSNVNIDLRVLHFKNIKYNNIDGWFGQDMIASIGKLDLEMDLLNLNKKNIALKEIILDKPYFSQNDYEGNKPNTPKKIKIKLPNTNAYQWNVDDWKISLASLTVKDGTYKNDKESIYTPYKDRFDGMHLNFTKLNGTIKNVSFVKDSLLANIAISGYEKSGLDIKNLNANFKLTPEIMEFKNLDLAINKSKLGNYFAMQYQDFIPDFNDFIYKVSLDCNFKNSTINSDDLAIFAPALKNWNRIFNISGKSIGTVANFAVTNANIKTGNSVFEGNIALKGLPDIESTFIDLQSNNLNTSYNELAGFMPALKNIKSPSIASLGNINYVGSFKGNIKDFTAKGNIKTALGNANADFEMNMLTKVPTYVGTLQSSGFNIGQFLGAKEIGGVALDIQFDGAGFDVKDLKEKIKGNVKNISVGNYTYNNINIDGTISNKIFRGHTAIADANLKISTLDGEIDFTESTPGFKLTANVEKADFKNLGLIKEDFVFAGDLDVNFKGNTIDNFLGNAKINNAKLLKGNRNLSFDFLNLQSNIVNGKKVLILNTNELDANIAGNFKVAEIPDAVSFLLAKYYPRYIKAPKYKVTSIQNFIYDITTKNIDEYTGLIDKKLTGFNNSHFAGSFDLQAYNIQLNATIPQFEYDKKTFNNINLKSEGNGENLLTNITVEEIKINDSLTLPFSTLKINTKNDVSDINLTSSANKFVGNAELNASITSLDEGFRINFSPSTFVINNKKWQLEKDGVLLLTNAYINANEIKFFNGNQAIILSTEESQENNDNYLTAKLVNIDAKDFAFVLPKNPVFKGILNGKVKVSNVLTKPTINFVGYADSVEINGEKIGKIETIVDVNTKTGNLTFSGKTNEQDYKLIVDGKINIYDSTGAGLDINIGLDTLKLAILKPYLKSVFSNMDGYAVGKIKISRANNKMSIEGNPILKQGNFTIGYTQVQYHLNNQPIVFGKKSIDLNGLNVKDDFGNTGTLGGIIYHDFFDNFYFEAVRFETNRMQLLNTKRKDNQQFYGKIIGNAKMSLDGPIANMKMNITGEPSKITKDSNHVILLTGNSKENGAVDYIDFIQFGNQMEKEVSGKGISNLLVNLKLIANPACKIDVVLDEENGDVVKGQGNGELNIRVGTTEDLSIRGRYDITEGEYTFNFQTLIRKPFTVNNGSIVWNGDPLLAVLDIDAEYLVRNVDLNSIKSSSSSSRIVEDLIIKSKIKGYLKSPIFDLGLKLTDKSANKNDISITNKFSQYKADENEINRQVVSLLLFGQLISQDQAFLNVGSIPSLVTGTLGGYVSSWLTGILNKQLDKATNGIVSIAVDLNPTISSQAASILQTQIRSSLQFRVSKNIRILVGSTFDVIPNPLTQQYGNKPTPDFTLEWLINKDGSIRVLANNRSTVDLTSGRRNRTSLQLGYKRDVDRFGDFFRSKKRIAYLDSIKLAKQNAIVKPLILDTTK
jgi:TamB, inner membrane protein subunit of TAM complex